MRINRCCVFRDKINDIHMYLIVQNEKEKLCKVTLGRFYLDEVLSKFLMSRKPWLRQIERQAVDYTSTMWLKVQQLFHLLKSCHLF